MYPSKYKSIFRIHTLGEAIAYPLKDIGNPADFFLYLLDVYDLLLSYADGSHPDGSAQPSDFHNLRRKLEEWSFPRFDMLQETIPGTLKGWTQGMFVFLLCCNCRLLALEHNSFTMSFEVMNWVRENRVRMFVGNSTAQLSYAQVLDSMDGVTRQWRSCEKNQQCTDYLDLLENRAALLITQTLTEDDLDMPFLRRDVGDGRYQLHPTGIYDLYTLFTCVRRSYAQYHMFNVIPNMIDLGEHRWDQWLAKEQRHLTVRKFRDVLETSVQWDFLRPSEWIRASYAQRGSKISPYIGLAANRPLAMLDELSNKCAYGDPPELYEDDRIVNVVHLNIVHATFMSIYTVNFKNYFFCSEEKSWKHYKKMAHAIVPFILQRSERYDVMYKNELYESKSGMFYEAFLSWLMIIRTQMQGVCYNGAMDFTKMCRDVFDKPIIIESRKLTNNASEYQWD